jgi:hypothetical protein
MAVEGPHPESLKAAFSGRSTTQDLPHSNCWLFLPECFVAEAATKQFSRA